METRLEMCDVCNHDLPETTNKLLKEIHRLFVVFLMILTLILIHDLHNMRKFPH